MTIDAAAIQKRDSKKIWYKRADYVLAVKGNQDYLKNVGLYLFQRTPQLFTIYLKRVIFNHKK